MARLMLVCEKCLGNEFYRAQDKSWTCTSCGSTNTILVPQDDEVSPQEPGA